MRDGITLSMTVHLPGPADKGPYPTVIEYSGYSPADPKSPQPSTLIAQALGYATVGINMRGTGCSGGAFNYFEQLQSTDGYDAIETIAAQPWVAHHKVGMVGLSYPGDQPAVRRAAPAAAPRGDRAVVGDRRHDQGNARSRAASSTPASRSRGRRIASTTPSPRPAAASRGRPIASRRGDKTCLANQALHSQAPDVIQQIKTQQLLDRRDRSAALARALRRTRSTCRCTSPATGRTSRPAATSPTCSVSSPGRRRRGSPRRTAATPIRSTRRSSRAGCSSCRSSSRRRSRTRPRSRASSSSTVANMAFGATAPLPPDPFANVTTYAQAKQLFESFPRVRILFENGGGSDPGAPAPRFEADYPSWPVPEHDRDAVVLRRRRLARRRRAGRERPPTRTCTTRRTSTTRRSPAGARARRG